MLGNNLVPLLFKRTYLPVKISHVGFPFKNCVVSSRNARSFTRPTCINNTKIDALVIKSLNLPICNSYNGGFRSRTIWQVQLSKITLENFRFFHTSERRYLHPVLWVFVKPVLKLLAILSGRAFRKWWKDLPPNKKKYFMNEAWKNRKNITAFFLASVLLSVLYYISHLEDTPITKRRRFVAFSSKQLEKMNQYEFQQLTNSMQNQILPANHFYSLRVQKVVNRILLANQDIKEMKQKRFGITVVNNSIENAFVLPVGQVFVFTGMLRLCSNDDQLGIILSHEIAHCLQNHGAENISFTHLLDLISIVVIAAIWAILPSDVISIITHWTYSKLSKILFQLPYNRKIETEADNVGLQLAAKACFDIRESSAFWSKMALLSKDPAKVPRVEFLSTHPNHETRSEYLDSIMDQALKLRNECGCPMLKQTDPRREVENMAKHLDITRRKYLEQHPKPVYSFWA